MEVVTGVLSKLLAHVRGVITETIKKYLLNVKERPSIELLEVGDKLCRDRVIPMSPQLITKVTQIYNCCHFGINSEGDIPLITARRFRRNESDHNTPLMKALDMGLMNMVWGFIECTKQTNSNLLTHVKGDEAVEEFLWVSNISKSTAFDVAIGKNQVEVATILLNHVPLRWLESQLHRRGKELLPLLNNYPKYDSIIFQMLEERLRSGQTLHEQESKININENIENQLNSYKEPRPERNERWEVSSDHDLGLLGSNPSSNLILHLVSKFGEVRYARKFCEEYPSIRNSNGETLAYVAAREGRADILHIMIECTKLIEKESVEGIATREMDNDNALHIAIQNHHVEVIFLLINEIPQLANRVNDFNISPLYLAAERKYSNVVELMLEKCKDINVEGPNGKTALHAAAISNSAECIDHLLKKRSDLLNDKDKHGWTALSDAVYFNSSLATAKLLDNVDNSIEYQLMKEDDIYASAVHIAASQGHYETMKVLLSKCHGCSEFTDNKGRNILHVAVENKKNIVIEHIFQDDSLTSLINQKDSNGNTPAHLLVASDFEMMERVMDFRVDINVLNNENKTPLDMTSSYNQRERLIKRIAMGTSIRIKENTRSDNVSEYDHKEKEYVDEEKELEAKRKEAEARFKIAENLVVVVTLIATASFAAGITLPGGLHSNEGSEQGTPFLLRKAAFRAFIVTDAMAFSCSCTVLLIYVALLLFRSQYVEASLADQEYINDRIVVMYVFTANALFAMAIAFVTGVYVVLAPSLGLAIFVCVMSLLTIGVGVQHSMNFEDKKTR